MIGNRVLYFLISGESLLCGISFVILALGMSYLIKPLIVSISRILFLFGVVLICVSTIPIQPVVFILYIVASIAYIVTDSVPTLKIKNWLRLTVSITVILSLTLVFACELPYLRQQKIIVTSQPIYILGDSISAGLQEEGVIPYPELLNQSEELTVINLSQGGIKIAESFDLLDNIKGEDQTVLVVLGGNDWRRGGDNKGVEYKSGAKALMTQLTNGHHNVIFMIIPFPPFEYGLAYAQRDVIDEFKPQIITRKFLANILLGTEDATSDGMHLTKSGHERFKRELEKLL